MFRQIQRPIKIIGRWIRQGKYRAYIAFTLAGASCSPQSITNSVIDNFLEAQVTLVGPLAQFLHQIIIYCDCRSHICIIIGNIFYVKMPDCSIALY